MDEVNITINTNIFCSCTLKHCQEVFSPFRCRLSNLSMQNDESSVNLYSNKETSREIFSGHVKYVSWQERRPLLPPPQVPVGRRLGAGEV